MNSAAAEMRGEGERGPRGAIARGMREKAQPRGRVALPVIRSVASAEAKVRAAGNGAKMTKRNGRARGGEAKSRAVEATGTNGGAWMDIYRRLHTAYGPQGWWPGDGPTEIIVGAILTQNTNWRNVEKAIANLRRARLLDWRALRDVNEASLAEQIRPAGYFNVKARRLKHFVEWLWTRHDGRLENLAGIPTPRLREELLAIHGIGPETADSILLYALDRPTFVIDAYTRRMAVRHGLATADVGYEALKAAFEDGLPRSRRVFNEYHALIVELGKRHCRPTPQCSGCPLECLPHAI